MASVTQRINRIKQPRGGYLNPHGFTKIEFDDGEICGEENIHASLVGLAVDYLTRVMTGVSISEAFNISIRGARNVGEEKKARKLLKLIQGLDDKSICAACQVVGYDVCYRVGPLDFKDVSRIKPDFDTIRNIRIMVKRSLSFFEEYGPVVKDGFTFEGGYTDLITVGDGDFLTSDTLWDFKVSKKDLSSKQTLQLLVYYIMGQHSIYDEFGDVKKLGVFNPRQNCIYLKDIGDIPDDIITEVASVVIGYKNKDVKGKVLQQDNGLLSMAEIMRLLSCSRHMVMKYYAENNLPLIKFRNRYMISVDDLAVWVEKMAAAKQRRARASAIVGITVIVVAILLMLFCLPLIGYLLDNIR